MADLSETSVVLALRDWQWLRAVARRDHPAPCIGFSGRAESRLGDHAMPIDGRYFLLEVKGTRGGINDEWKPEKEKHAYKFVERLAAAFVARDTPIRPGKKEKASLTGIKQLEYSVQCHHFAYWASGESGRGLACRTGHLFITPYLLGVMERNFSMTWRLIRTNWLDAYDLGMLTPNLETDPAGHIRCERGTVAALDTVGAGEVRVLRRYLGTSTALPLGLPFTEFQSYVNGLCDEVPDGEALNVVVMDTEGHFFAHATSTNALRQILEPPSGPGTQLTDSAASVRKKARAQPARFDVAVETARPRPANTITTRVKP